MYKVAISFIQPKIHMKQPSCHSCALSGHCACASSSRGQVEHGCSLKWISTAVYGSNVETWKIGGKIARKTQEREAEIVKATTIGARKCADVRICAQTFMTFAPQ